MVIYKSVKFQGVRSKIQKKALIDTGLDITIIPLSLAEKIGVSRIRKTVSIEGIHGKTRKLPLGFAQIHFPSLNNIGGKYLIAISDKQQEPIIGIDILTLLGISIDTKTHCLSVRNEGLEAFMILVGIGVLMFANRKILKEIFSYKPKS